MHGPVPAVREGLSAAALLSAAAAHQAAFSGRLRRQCLRGLASWTKKVSKIDWYLEFSGLL